MQPTGPQRAATEFGIGSDAAGLLAPHAPALAAHVRDGDPRILDLVRAGAELADEVGADAAGWPELFAALDNSDAGLAAKLAQPIGLRDDYALAAGGAAGPRGRRPDRTGVASVDWSAEAATACDADWSATSVIVGTEVSAATKTRETRERVRRWARARLDRPPNDAFPAEVRAAESDY